MKSRLKLDISKLTNVVQTVYVGRGDRNGTVLDMTVYDWGIPADLAGTSAKVMMRLSDGEMLSLGCTVVSPNKVGVTIDARVIGDRLVEFAYLAIEDGDRVYSTERFAVVVVAGNPQGVRQ